MIAPAIRNAMLPRATLMAPRGNFGARSVRNLAKVAYTAKGQATGQGRNGVASLTAEGPFEVKLAMPKSLGGKGDGQNPEQLFGEKSAMWLRLSPSLGYSSCFLSALSLVAREEKMKLPSGIKVEAHVSIGPPSEGSAPFALPVQLVVTSDGKGQDDNQVLQRAVDKAHQVCPYSNATRNNLPVTITVE